MTTHELKTWPTYFEPVWSGAKTFEIRYDDRGYQRGDTVLLREWDRDRPCECHQTRHLADCGKYTGRELKASIGHVTASTPAKGNQRGFVGHGYVVFSLCEVRRNGGSPGLSPALLAKFGPRSQTSQVLP